MIVLLQYDVKLLSTSQMRGKEPTFCTNQSQ
jgi:hypothetical protein